MAEQHPRVRAARFVRCWAERGLMCIRDDDVASVRWRIRHLRHTVISDRRRRVWNSFWATGGRLVRIQRSPSTPLLGALSSINPTIALFRLIRSDGLGCARPRCEVQRRLSTLRSGVHDHVAAEAAAEALTGAGDALLLALEAFRLRLVALEAPLAAFVASLEMSAWVGF